MECSNLFQMLCSSLPSPSPPLPLVGITAFILLYIIILYLFVDLSENGISFSSPSRAENCILGLSVAEIKELPWFLCGGNFTAICAVCLDGVQKGERCRMFPVCKHVFHARCIDLWLIRSLTCPTCRSPIRTKTNLNLV